MAADPGITRAEALREIATLKRSLAETQRALELARKHVMDSYMGAAITGLAARWSWEDTSPERLVMYAERLAHAAMKRRHKWNESLPGESNGK